MENLAIFLTDRLGCRHWVPDDISDIYGVYSDEEGARYVGDGQPITHQECEEWMQVTLANYENRGYGMFALFDRTNEKTVGFCGLVHPGGQIEAEVKYSFYRDYWGKGYASEIVPALLKYASETFGLQKVIATVAEGNAASRRVLEKSGMIFVEKKSEDDGSTTLLYEWHHDRAF